MITASAGKLFSSACQEELSLKISIRNTLHAEIINTSPFIKAEIKFTSLMSFFVWNNMWELVHNSAQNRSLYTLSMTNRRVY